MPKIIRELLWTILAVFFIVKMPSILPVYSNFDMLNIVIGVIAFVGSVRYIVMIITEDYPVAKPDAEFDTRLESCLLCKDEDDTVKFKEWVDVFWWWIFGVGIVVSIFLFDHIDLYMMIICVLFFMASYLMYIRKKAFYRQMQEVEY